MTKAKNAETIVRAPAVRASAAAVANISPGMMLEPKRIALPGHGWNTHEATIPAETPANVLLDGKFWRRVATRLQRGDHVRWRDDSLTRFGELVVVGCDQAMSTVEVRELWTQNVVRASMVQTETGGFSVRDLGVFDKFAIVRDGDDMIVEKGIASFDEAMRRIKVVHVPNRNMLAAHGTALPTPAPTRKWEGGE